MKITKKNWTATKLEGRLVKIENNKTGEMDIAIKYHDGGIAYDFPERIPAYAKQIVKAVFDAVTVA